jgi:hypothetical protein
MLKEREIHPFIEGFYDTKQKRREKKLLRYILIETLKARRAWNNVFKAMK